MSKHETEMHRDRRELIAALRAICQLHDPAMKQSRAFFAAIQVAHMLLDRFPQPPCDDGLFGDNSQMDLADRRDIKREDV